MLHDLRAVLRGLTKSRGFTGLVVVSLALGVGVNSAMFTAIDSLLLRKIPATNPEELILLKRSGAAGEQPRFSYPAYRYFRDANHTLSGIGGVTIVNRVRTDAGVEGRSQTERVVTAQMVTGGFFDVLGVKPHIGRLISPADDQVPGSHAVAVISHAYWRGHFGSDGGVIGRSTSLNEVPFTIIGVAPQEFYGVEPGAAPDLWVPAMMQGTIMDLPSLVNVQTFNWLYLFARPKMGVERARVVADLTLLQQQFNALRAQQTQAEPVRRNILSERLQVNPAGGGVTQLADNFRQPMVTLMAAVAVVLFMSCLNLSMLALARMTQRTKEIAIRLAVGAKPSQIIRYLSLESVVLVSIGTVVGTVLGQASLTFAAGLIPAGPTRIPIALDTALNYHTLGFSVSLAALIMGLFTAVPAVRISRGDLVNGLSDNVRRLIRRDGGRSGPIRNLIIVAQVAASVVLLICGALLLQTLRNLRSQELGFDADRATAFQVTLPRTYQRDHVHQFTLHLLDRLMTMSELEAATFGSPSLLSGYESRMLVATGDSAAAVEAQIESNGMTVAPNFFSTMKIGLVAGRAFGAQDTAGAPAVGIINETAARVMFPGHSAVGQRIRVRTADTSFAPPFEIVGVVHDIRFRDLRSRAGPLIYRPAAQQTMGFADGFVVKATLNRAVLEEMLRREIGIVDPNGVLDRVETFPQRIDRWAERERIFASIAGIFGVLALMLACLGMYGITSMIVSNRRREIAVRLAIGSSLLQVTWLFVRQSFVIAIAGSVIGLPAALLISRVLTVYFFNVTPLASAGLWSALVLAVAVPTSASWLAVRSEGRVEPASALKST